MRHRQAASNLRHSSFQGSPIRHGSLCLPHSLGSSHSLYTAHSPTSLALAESSPTSHTLAQAFTHTLLSRTEGRGNSREEKEGEKLTEGTPDTSELVVLELAEAASVSGVARKDRGGVGEGLGTPGKLLGRLRFGPPRWPSDTSSGTAGHGYTKREETEVASVGWGRQGGWRRRRSSGVARQRRTDGGVVSGWDARG